jgi:diguanylate cyclase (GGDEF)-like protein/PAS domain S-box-containing protein
MSENWSLDHIVRRLAVMRTATLCASSVLVLAVFFLTEGILQLSVAGGAASPSFSPVMHVLAHVLQLLCASILVVGACDAELFAGSDVRRLQSKVASLERAVGDRDAAVSQARDAEARRFESDARFSSIFECSASGMVVTSLDGHLLQVNRSFCEMLGYSEAELRRSSVLAITHPDDVPNSGAMLRAIAGGAMGPFRVEKRYLTKEGRVVTALLSIGVVRDQEGRPLYCASQIEDITARRRAEESVARYAADLRNLALTDDLTGLHNRRGFRTVAEQICAAQARNSQPLMLVAIDVDYLKAINDTWGHEAGDRAIVVVATALSSSFRTSDVIARIGGDEFLCLLPNAGDDDVTQIRLRIASRIARQLQDLPQEFPLTVTVGVAVAPPRAQLNLESLMREADRALYDSKRGRPTRDAVGVRRS